MTGHITPFSDRKHYYEHAEWIHEHVSKFFEDKCVKVLHEILALDLRIDVFLIQPENTSYAILLTCGMSTLKMNVDVEVAYPQEHEFTELLLLLPKPIALEVFTTGTTSPHWTLSMLKQAAKYPHLHNTWLGIGHSLQATMDKSPYSEQTEFVGALVLPSVSFDKDFTEIHKNGRKISFYTLFPLYKDELQFKIEKGYHQLLELIIQANAKEVLDFQRKSLLAKPSLWNRLLGKG